MQPEPGQFLSNKFLMDKKYGGRRPVINLKYLNAFMSYQQFKMEGMYLIKDLLQENDFLIKIDLKDAYFGIPLDKTSKKYICFQWEGNLYEFLCLCFDLVPAPLIFAKLLKVLFAKENRCENSNFRGQFASNDPNLEGTNTSKGIIDFSVTKVRFCNKSKKI